ncbi:MULTISPECIES: ABC transporter permease subunit [Streptomyces]|uniref:ABC transporter permease n=1 Tax=Streptomyces dengpaensis TaxID=2049881 RepID=A0ABN5HVX6_9ACTN|nr:MULTISPECIES: ABC transporter permease subunit [Streptomyces]AVH54698.1 ABC transporter permease [Streptomyces dengpaensis]PIA98545.1 hypothetical protein B1C81_39555 [Streptomyces sp. HG99]
MTVLAATATKDPERVAALPWFRDILRAEFIKLASVRSTFWTLATVVLSNTILAALAAVFLASRLQGEQAAKDPVRLSLLGLHISQLAIVVLGVLVVTGEYSSGLIRATLAAVPQRRTVLAAKTLAFTATALVVGVTASFAAYAAFQAFLSGTATAMKLSLGDPGVLRAVVGGGLYLTVLGLLGLGLGAALRSSAGGIAATLGLLMVPTILLSMLPQNWQTTIGPYIPMQAGDAIYSLNAEAGSLSTWNGLGVFSLYAALALTAGFWVIRRRDA